MRFALVHVEGRRADSERDKADVAAVGQDAIKVRGMISPGETGRRPLVAAQNEVYTALVQVAQGFKGAG